MRRLFITAVIALAAGTWPAAQSSLGPAPAPDRLTFAVIGDNGTGDKAQYEVGTQMAAAHKRTPFELVIMLGDNLYGRQKPDDFIKKFQKPYAPLLAAGVVFYAALGNHDDPNSRFYPAFNMGGQRYYTYVRKGVRFFVLDTNLLDRPQLAWFEDVLKQSREPWKIVYFHHPLYSNGGRHGSDLQLRVTLEPLLVAHGVSVVFSGHDHSYERFKPQRGITYFLAGSSGKLRRGDNSPTADTAAAFDQDQAFMVADLESDAMTFQTISRTGRVVDSGIVRRRTVTDSSAASGSR